ncbi:MAG TPA: polysaccharide deacetylase [bacterium]|nr:polysaccharide deacetylase [bacterium]
MARHLVCLTFDFDALSMWIARGMTTPTPISRGEFGAVGAERILALLRSYRIRSTWFIPGHTIETYPEICRRIHVEGHEIGNHGYLHEPPATLDSREREEAVLLRGNAAILGITGSGARGYRSPSWDLSPHTVDLLVAHGFLYDSSMMAHDCLPYRARHGDVLPADRPPRLGPATPLIEMPISWSLDDYPYFEYFRSPTHLQQGLRRAGDALENWVDDFRYMAKTEEWGVLTYTFHPQVVGRGHRMLALERLIEAVGEMGAVFARMDEVAAEYAARAPLGR